MMEIVKHKALDFSAQEILDMATGERAIPEDVVVNVTENGIVAEPVDGPVNLFGEVNDDYEMIYYSED